MDGHSGNASTADLQLVLADDEKGDSSAPGGAGRESEGETKHGERRRPSRTSAAPQRRRTSSGAGNVVTITVSPRHNGPLTLLPSDVLESIVELLDGASLMRCAITCTTIRHSCMAPRLWARVFYNDFMSDTSYDMRPGALRFVVQLPDVHAAYRERRREERRRTAAKQLQRRLARLAPAAMTARKRLQSRVECVTVLIGSVLAPLCVVAQLFFAVWSFDDSVNGSWPADWPDLVVLAPAQLAALCAAAALGTAAYARAKQGDSRLYYLAPPEQLATERWLRTFEELPGSVYTRLTDWVWEKRVPAPPEARKLREAITEDARKPEFDLATYRPKGILTGPRPGRAVLVASLPVLAQAWIVTHGLLITNNAAGGEWLPSLVMMGLFLTSFWAVHVGQRCQRRPPERAKLAVSMCGRQPAIALRVAWLSMLWSGVVSVYMYMSLGDTSELYTLRLALLPYWVYCGSLLLYWWLVIYASEIKRSQYGRFRGQSRRLLCSSGSVRKRIVFSRSVSVAAVWTFVLVLPVWQAAGLVDEGWSYDPEGDAWHGYSRMTLGLLLGATLMVLIQAIGALEAWRRHLRARRWDLQRFVTPDAAPPASVDALKTSLFSRHGARSSSRRPRHRRAFPYRHGAAHFVRRRLPARQLHANIDMFDDDDELSDLSSRTSWSDDSIITPPHHVPNFERQLS